MRPFASSRISLLLAALVGALMLAGASQASAAAGCYGNYCSGADPVATGCSADAITVAHVPAQMNTLAPSWNNGLALQTTSVYMGTIELRWSARCQTNWARLNLNDGAGGVEKICATQDSGYQQCRQIAGNYYGTGAGNFYSPMIYSPTLRVRAHIVGGDFSSWSTDPV